MIRNFGFKLGSLTFICDYAKGAISALLGKYLIFALTQSSEAALFGGYLLGLCAVLGHIYPVFLRFKGGKGIAASLGIFTVLHPIFTLCTLVVAVIIILTTDKVSIFALVHITSQMIYSAVMLLVFDKSELTVRVLSLVCVVIMWAVIIFVHRGNIVRLVKKEEKNSGIKKLVFRMNNVQTEEENTSISTNEQTNKDKEQD